MTAATTFNTKDQTSAYDEAGYSYETKLGHLTERKAIEEYKRAKQANPEALVTLDDLDCGHWAVAVHSTEQEKQAVLARKLADIFSQALAVLNKL